MKSFVTQIPTILGAMAAMIVAFLSLVSGTAAETCFTKAGAAFLVFAGFGLVLRYALQEALEQAPAARADNSDEEENGALDMVVPGASVADLLGKGANEKN